MGTVEINGYEYQLIRGGWSLGSSGLHWAFETFRPAYELRLPGAGVHTQHGGYDGVGERLRAEFEAALGGVATRSHPDLGYRFYG